MRLLDVHKLKLKEFLNDKTRPPYAILSHTWGEGEVSLQDLQTPTASDMSSYSKIKKCCEVAIQDGFEYVWIDTCCIDKTSSAELSEAINSMYLWYRSAGVCYAYLSDMQGGDDPSDPESSFSNSRWFTRGWTLQELLAPNVVIFYDRNWVDIGTKRRLQEDISRITGIPSEALLNGGKMERFCIAQRMSWAAKRETTRVEDIAYCLMGIFDVNMPTLYGEGKKAFIRLQYEIMKSSDDHSLFAWSIKPSRKFGPDSQDLGTCDVEEGRRILEAYFFSSDSHTQRTINETSGLLSSSPRNFEYSQGVRPMRDERHNTSLYSFSMTNNGLHIWLPLVQVPITNGTILHQITFNCDILNRGGALTVFVYRKHSGQYSRIVPTLLCTAECHKYHGEPVELYVKEDYLQDSEEDKPLNYQFRFVKNPSPNEGYILLGASSPQILQKKMVNLLMISRYPQLNSQAASQAGIAYIIVGAKHDPSARCLVALGVTLYPELRIFYKIRTEKKGIEEAIAKIDKTGNNQLSAGQFRNAFKQWLQRVYIGEQIFQELPSGQIISITFRKGPESSDGVYICHLIVEFVSPGSVKLPTPFIQYMA